MMTTDRNAVQNAQTQFYGVHAL